MKKSRFHIRKLNNSGLSLVELLVSVLILAIVVAPFLHSYVTGANTNNKARVTMNGTTLAEDVMEEFEASSIADLKAMKTADGNLVYTYDDSTGKIIMTTNGSHFDSSLSSYNVEIELDASAYATVNAQNVSDVHALKPDVSGVYAMLPEADDSAYLVFAKRSESSAGDPGYEQCNSDYFRQNLKREIRIIVTTGGFLSVIEDGVTKNIRQVSVSVEVIYELDASKRGPNGGIPVQDLYRTYTETTEIYDNSGSKAEFESIYLMYTPRFGDYVTNPDTIRIVNKSNVSGTCFIIRQDTDRDNAGAFNLSNYKALIQLEEKPDWNGVADWSTKRSAMRIRTNLFKKTEALSDANIKFVPKYKNDATNVVYETPTANVLKVMGAQTVDGRNFDGSANKNRIYTMKVKVTKGSDTIVTLTGTKTE